MNRDVTVYLSDIMESVAEAAGFVSSMSYAEFEQDKKTVNAVVRSMEIIGEAAKHVPEGIRVRNAAIPWRNMAGMRDRCIHAYARVDNEMVWNVVKNDIPRIRPLVQGLLEELRAQEQEPR